MHICTAKVHACNAGRNTCNKPHIPVWIPLLAFKPIHNLCCAPAHSLPATHRMVAPALHTLDLSHTAATGLECLQGASRLTALNLAGCSIGDGEAQMIAHCTRLKTLVLTGSGVGASGVQQLGSLPLIQVMRQSCIVIQSRRPDSPVDTRSHTHIYMYMNIRLI